jgi:hypothetical protein
VSGHTLKHLAAAAASWWIYTLVRDRRALSVNDRQSLMATGKHM